MSKYFGLAQLVLLLWAESVADERGVVQSLWGTTQDVTDQRTAEAAIRRLAVTDSLTGLANRAHLQDRAGRARLGRGAASARCCCWTSTGSRRSTTPWATSSATSCWSSSGGGWLAASRRRPHGRAAGRRRVPRRRSRGGTWRRGRAGRAGDGRRRPSRSRSRATPSRSPPGPASASRPPAAARASRASDLYREADIALYAAKDSRPRTDRGVRRRAGGAHRTSGSPVEAALRDALSRRRRAPAVPADHRAGATPRPRTGWSGARRWPGSGRTCDAVSPVAFVPVAEETGLIASPGRGGVRARGRARCWRPTGPGAASSRVAVNLSPRSLQVPGLADRLAPTLERLGLDGRPAADRDHREQPGRADPGAARARWPSLRGLGARVGIDDFGTGYSALSYLQRFELEFLKVDRSFVARVTHDAKARAVIRALVDLAHAHDLTVVAEGVETAEQLEIIRELGLRQGPGLPARPADDAPQPLLGPPPDPPRCSRSRRVAPGATGCEADISGAITGDSGSNARVREHGGVKVQLLGPVTVRPATSGAARSRSGAARPAGPAGPAGAGRRRGRAGRHAGRGPLGRGRAEHQRPAHPGLPAAPRPGRRAAGGGHASRVSPTRRATGSPSTPRTSMPWSPRTWPPGPGSALAAGDWAARRARPPAPGWRSSTARCCPTSATRRTPPGAAADAGGAAAGPDRGPRRRASSAPARVPDLAELEAVGPGPPAARAAAGRAGPGAVRRGPPGRRARGVRPHPAPAGRRARRRPLARSWSRSTWPSCARTAVLPDLAGGPARGERRTGAGDGVDRLSRGTATCAPR